MKKSELNNHIEIIPNRPDTTNAPKPNRGHGKGKARPFTKLPLIQFDQPQPERINDDAHGRQ
ncbi:hypothetical protein LCGC14_0681830 [marine sediment metagenome]|uniref:Uncharacterized protein n=1 Tax=marine sediment metagenome TaxID=412755 RepID=A0A0F9QMZ7_9ZZZZ